ncbi:DNA-3-methyladenine glycosylase I [Rhodopirellula europaea]|uniref:DNA-3-methyladenine glycosylase I n=1 Tax=Rhodopirellula europaea SH398 TaxID=1263868 RepID=M5S9Z2_9BACT|nr:DNA-3-methyladenine glycosylase I [Rhodopirellula europaea]EMI24487.1 DNA-3-methyladenine glycosylase I [Rhodopirellula europaea SH398]
MNALPQDLLTDEEGNARCGWCGTDADYVRYHDLEWGVPVRDDLGLFEKICLEGFQCGLSWITILKRREAFRECFVDFDPRRLAKFTPSDVERLMTDSRIIRNRAKIEATIQNARTMTVMLDRDESLADLLWQFAPKKRRLYRRLDQVPAITDESTKMSRVLKKAGWKFVGPTTCYALMQSAGMVNDHLDGCFRHGAVKALR